jgi:hypothetical protein
MAAAAMAAILAPDSWGQGLRTLGGGTTITPPAPSDVTLSRLGNSNAIFLTVAGPVTGPGALGAARMAALVSTRREAAGR